jgi:hypothetical protein
VVADLYRVPVKLSGDGFQVDPPDLALGRYGRSRPIPGTAGLFDVRANGETDLVAQNCGRFTDIKQLKQLVRDRTAPGMDLGASDR